MKEVILSMFLILVVCIASACSNLPSAEEEQTSYACIILMQTKYTSERGEEPLRFSLLDEDGTVIQTVECDEDGKFEFDALSFEDSDAGKTYTYMVKQERPESATVMPDPIARRVEVSVKEENVGVQIIIKYPDGSQFNPVFTTPSD